MVKRKGRNNCKGKLHAELAEIAGLLIHQLNEANLFIPQNLKIIKQSSEVKGT